MTLPAKSVRSELPPQQQKLLDVILDVVGERFDNTHENFHDLRQEMGCAQGELHDLMQALQLKGYLRREVRRGHPKLWIVNVKSPGGGGIATAPGTKTCWECGIARVDVGGLCAVCGASPVQPTLPRAFL